jgi:hypothetical protein
MSTFPGIIILFIFRYNTSFRYYNLYTTTESMTSLGTTAGQDASATHGALADEKAHFAFFALNGRLEGPFDPQQ